MQGLSDLDIDREISPDVQYAILQSALVTHGARRESKAFVEIFHCLEMSHPACPGKQRIRCYPFEREDLQYREKWIKPPVMLVPADVGREDFCFSTSEHYDKIYYARVLLFFRVLLNTDPVQSKDLAFIRYFDRYLVQGKQCIT